MRTYLDCLPCFLRQPLEAARMATDDLELQETIMQDVLTYLQTADLETPPPDISKDVHAIVKHHTKNPDPYKEVKHRSNQQVLQLLPTLQKDVIASEDPLLTALQYAIIGNVIDFGSAHRFSLQEILSSKDRLHIDQHAYHTFQDRLQDTTTILYLADNAGEIVFDLLLLSQLKQLGKQITYVVKNAPIINDATTEDAITVGIQDYASIITPYTNDTLATPGILLKYATDSFLHHFNTSDLVISKGQGNYESLNTVDREMVFLLVVKCDLVARNIGHPVGELVLEVQHV